MSTLSSDERDTLHDLASQARMLHGSLLTYCLAELAELDRQAAEARASRPSLIRRLLARKPR